MRYRGDNVGISGASAQIAAHVFANLRRAFRVALFDAADRGHDLARSAVAALERIEVDEGLLHRVELAVRPRQAFDGRHPPVVRHHCKRETGQDAAPIDMHRAGAALPVIATLLRSREADMLAQSVEERDARIDREEMGLTIDVEGNGRELVRWPLPLFSGSRLDGCDGQRCA
jgi:hypothetical protein